VKIYKKIRKTYNLINLNNQQ